MKLTTRKQIDEAVRLIDGKGQTEAEAALRESGWHHIGRGCSRAAYRKHKGTVVVKVNRQGGSAVWTQAYREYMVFQSLHAYRKYRQFFAAIYWYDEQMGHIVAEYVNEVGKARNDDCPLCMARRSPYTLLFLGPYYQCNMDAHLANHGHRTNGMPVLVDYGITMGYEAALNEKARILGSER